MDDADRSFTGDSVVEEQKKDTWCQELLKTLEDKVISEFIEADTNQCMFIEDMIYHKDKHENSLDDQLQLDILEVFRR